jgi:hypothetical protein
MASSRLAYSVSFLKPKISGRRSACKRLLYTENLREHFTFQGTFQGTFHVSVNIFLFREHFTFQGTFQGTFHVSGNITGNISRFREHFRAPIREKTAVIAKRSCKDISKPLYRWQVASFYEHKYY